MSSPEAHFPVVLVLVDLGWKLAAGYDRQARQFTLSVNGWSFFDLSYQASLAPIGPMLIEAGVIKMNGNEIKLHKSKWNVLQFIKSTFKASDKQPITEVELCED